MSAQRIVWTTLPNGATLLDSGLVRLRFSVLASPRLVTDGATGTLRDFPTFHDWPATLAGLSFSLRFEGGPTYPASLDPGAPYSARSDVWTGLFGLATPVTSHVFDDHTGEKVLSYAEQPLLGTVSETYGQTVLAAPQVPPSPAVWNDPSSGLPDLFRQLEVDRESIAQDLRSLLQNQGYVGAGDVATPVEQITLLEEFHGGQKDIASSTPATDPEAAPPFDFHQAVAVAGQYPMLQRLLGLVIDLYVDVPPSPMEATGDAIPLEPLPTEEQNVRVEVRPDPSQDPLWPWTKAAVARDVFRAVPLIGSLLADGLLRADDASAFTPITVDLDGAVMKLLGLAPAVIGPANPLTPQALAGLRSGGVSLALKDRAAALVAAFARAKALDQALVAPGAAPTAVFHADDLLRGLRVDVWEQEQGRWSSLVARQGTLAVGSAFGSGVAGLPPLADEGYVSTSPTTKDSDPGVLYLPESLFNWTGWSLATAQPGNALTNPPASGAPGVAVEDPEADGKPQPGLDVVVQAHPAPASLPILRFGNSYRLRARAMDLAGNGLALGDPTPSDFTRATPLFRYGRFEPVPAPEVLFHEQRTEGETVERIVIRSESPTQATTDTTDRHIAPPKTSWQLAEQHGLFDRVAGGRKGPNPAAWATYGSREQGGFGQRQGALPDAGGNVVIVKHPDAVADPNGTVDSFYYPVDSVAINFLPDALGRGACFQGLPGTATHQKYGFLPGTTAWPAYKPFRLSLREGSGAPGFQETDTARVLSVFLGKADVVEVLLSSHLASGDENSLGLFDWVKSLNAAAAEALRPAAVDGLLWALTPFRRLVLVHAVRVPLASPEPRDFASTRSPDDTFAEISGVISFSRKSTSRVDVTGSWTDCVDDPAVQITDPAQFARPGEAPAFSIDADRVLAAPDQKDDRLAIKDRHEFGDTRHRVVTYSATAVTRFAEYFIERLAHTAQTVGHYSLPITAPAGLVKGSVTVKSQDGAITFVEGTDYTVDYASGDTALIVKPNPAPNEIVLPAIRVGTKLDVSFLANPVSVSSAEPMSVSIPSSARPAPPSIEYIVPTFGWNYPAGPGSASITSTRRGKGLRVYMNRPWYSSGCGELLGVVLWQAPTPVEQVFPDAPPYVTHWVLDPLYRGSSLPRPWPVLASFPGAEIEDRATGLTLPEFGQLVTFGSGQVFLKFPVDVAGHQVQFDSERQLWFCDIEVDVGAAYSPFIRLALARYQPNSLPGLELSQVVRADYAQLAPDRALSIVRLPGSKIRVTLSGIDAPTQVGGGIAQAWLERKDVQVASEDLGWTRVGSIVQLTAGPSLSPRVWSSQLALPQGVGRLRVVVQQFERFPGTPTGAILAPGAALRLVHNDIVEI